MSSKSTDGGWSITRRLVALFTLSASVLLLVVVAILYRAIEQHLDEEHEHLLAEIVGVLRQATVMREVTASGLVEQVGRIASDQPQSYSDPYALRVIDAQRRVLAESAGMAAIPIGAFTQTPSTSSGRARFGHWTAPNGEAFLLATIEAPAGGSEPSRSIVQVALNVTRDRILMTELRNIAVVLLVASLIVAALAGATVVRQSLRPLERIAGEVAHISAQELRRRLPAGGRPRELVPLVESFNRVLDRLDRAFAHLSEFSENLAHELRTPLNNLRGEAEVALLQQRKPDEYREVLMSSLEEYERLSNMIDGLLFLARAESHETKPAWRVLPLAGEARAVCDIYGPVAEEKGIALAVEGNASAGIDAVLFRRALGNLIANALANVATGGHVAIAIANDNGATVSVIDDGRGIAPEDLPHVMDRFYRGNGARTEGTTGSGLGLAIVKSIVDLHGGTISIHSTIGRGTTVMLRFPPVRQKSLS